ncbi:MAG: hypothetical protein KDA89_02120, partial [Planctomycetaceae bacterium]|nr:hypothetical protein [Planctomycetaceae bacterium]
VRINAEAETSATREILLLIFQQIDVTNGIVISPPVLRSPPATEQATWTESVAVGYSDQPFHDSRSYAITDRRQESGKDSQDSLACIAEPNGLLSLLGHEFARFPWPRPPESGPFFDGLHIQVRVAPKRRQRSELIRQPLPQIDLQSETEEIERRTYQSRAAAAAFADEGAAPVMTWSARRNQEGAREKFPWAVVLADPGMGKTTLLRYEGWKTATDQQRQLLASELNLQDVLIPVFIRLGDLAGSTQFASTVDFLVQTALTLAGLREAEFPRSLQQFLEKQLRSGKFVLLLDAQDEVIAEDYKRVTESVRALLKLNPVRVYLSSRHGGYRGNLLLQSCENVPEIEIVAFSADNVRDFISAFFGKQLFGKHSLLAKTVWNVIRRQPALLGLSQTPLLLTMLCVSIWQRKGYRTGRHELLMPTRRGDLYAEVLDGLLGRWPMFRTGLIATPSVEGEEVDSLAAPRRCLLTQVNWLLSAHEPARRLFPRQDVIDAIKQFPDLMAEAGWPDPNTSLDRLSRECGVLARVSNTYMFLHLTFQEYLTAVYLARIINRDGWGSARVLIPDKRQHRVVPVSELLNHWSWLPEWQEIIPLLAGELVDPVPLLELLTDEKMDDIFRHRLALAAKCLAEIPALIDEADRALL